MLYLFRMHTSATNFFNMLHHSKGKDSKYTYENVCVVPGGRAGLTRLMAALGMYVAPHPLPLHYRIPLLILLLVTCLHDP